MADDAAAQRIYKVASLLVMGASDDVGSFSGMPIDNEDGYIHFSTAAQLRETLRLHFAGQSGLVLFAVDAAALGAELKWEPSRGGQLFPHLYAELPMDMITERAEINVGADGTVDLPDWVR